MKQRDDSFVHSHTQKNRPFDVKNCRENLTKEPFPLSFRSFPRPLKGIWVLEGPSGTGSGGLRPYISQCTFWCQALILKANVQNTIKELSSNQRYFCHQLYGSSSFDPVFCVQCLSLRSIRIQS